MQVEFDLTRSLHSYVVPEGHKNYSQMSNSIQISTNKFNRVLSEVGLQTMLIEMSIFIWFERRSQLDCE